MDLNFIVEGRGGFTYTMPFLIWLYEFYINNKDDITYKILNDIIDHSDALNIDLGQKSSFGDDLLLYVIGYQDVNLVHKLVEKGVSLIDIRGGMAPGQNSPTTLLSYAKMSSATIKGEEIYDYLEAKTNEALHNLKNEYKG
jgi:hypothetical protein